MNPQQEKEEEKREIILKGDPRSSDYENFMDYLNDSQKYDNAVRFFVEKKFNLTEERKILDICYKFDEVSSSEPDYEDRLEKVDNKIRKMIDSAVLKRELKIKALEKELEELQYFQYYVTKKGADIMTIALKHEITYEIEKVYGEEK